MKYNHMDGDRLRALAGSGALVVGACFAWALPAWAEDAKPTEEKDASELVNWVEFGVGGNFVNGSRAQFQEQNGTPATGAYGGIEAFHFELPFNQKGLFTLDGRGIFDNHDYSIQLALVDPDKGYVRVGYTEFRTYYDATAGYLPSNGRIFNTLYDNRLELDRIHASFAAGLTLPDKPSISFQYDLSTRDGSKGSTSWGTTTLTPGGLRKLIAPALRDIDETRHAFGLGVQHNVGNTEVGLGGRYENQDNVNKRFLIQQPGEGTRSRILTTTEGVSADLGNFHAYTDTKLSEHWQFTTGYSFSTLHSALSGERRNTAIVTPLATTDTRYANLAGGSDLKQHVVNLNLMYSPSTNWYVVPAIRVESQNLDGQSTDNVITGTAIQTVSPVTQFANNDRGALYVAESLDVRYVGIKNWAFYARAELSEDRANLKENFGTNLLTAPTIRRSTDWDRLLQKYSVGANWYKTRNLNFGAQYYHRISANDYTSDLDSTSNATTSGDRFPGYLGTQNFDVDCVNFRTTWRPIPKLTLVSRYDFQISRAYTEVDFLPGIQSADNERHLFGETVSWTPLTWMYLQANANYVLDTTHSPVEDLTGAMAGVVLSAPNNYWIAGGTIGLVLDNKTDLQTSYSRYEANNYVDNSAVGMPYGSGAQEDEVSSTLVRRISDRLRWTLRYAYSNYRDETSGGYMNYEAHGILSTLHYRF
jgi:hypothetical protein